MHHECTAQVVLHTAHVNRSSLCKSIFGTNVRIALNRRLGYYGGMTQIINLRTARKQTTRAKSRQLADANTAKHGRSKAERSLQDARTTKARADLDAHKRAPDT